MLRDSYRELSSRLASHGEEIVLSTYENWPPFYQESAFAKPVCSLPVSVGLLERILHNENISREETDSWITPISEKDQRDMQATYFPKLGPVSWKELPPFKSVVDGELPYTLPLLLASVTNRMKVILQAFVDLGTPTFLHLFPFRDMSNLAEVRLTISKGNILNARLRYAPSGFSPSQQWRREVIDLALGLMKHNSLEAFYLDLCVDDLQSKIRARVLEINPIIPVFKGAN